MGGPFHSIGSQAVRIIEPNGLDLKIPCASDEIFGPTPFFLLCEQHFFSRWVTMDPPLGETFEAFKVKGEGRTESTNYIDISSGVC